MKTKKTKGNHFNFIANTCDTAAWIVKPFTAVGMVSEHARGAIRSVQAFAIAANMTADILDDQQRKENQ